MSEIGILQSEDAYGRSIHGSAMSGGLEHDPVWARHEMTPAWGSPLNRLGRVKS